MKLVFLLGVFAFAAVLLKPSEACNECNSCWNYKHCDITEFPWAVKRYYAVFVTKITLNNFWGNGRSCSVFSKCGAKACGCIGMDVGRIGGRTLKGQWFAYHRIKHMQFMRRYYAVVAENNAEITFFFSNMATWKVPMVVVKKVTCDECGTTRIETYKVPDAEVKTQVVSFEVKGIMLILKLKFRILLFCNGLRGITNNQPFAIVLATEPEPGKDDTWVKINAALRHYNFDPHKMVFLKHNSCVYPPFDWCNTWVEPKNPDCNICKIDK